MFCPQLQFHNLSFFGRLLIQYGLMRGLIRHLQKYPVLVEPDPTETNLPDSIEPYAK